MNSIHSANSSKAGRKHHRHPSGSSALQKLRPFASRWLGLTLATGSFLFSERLSAVTPLAWGDGQYGELGDGNYYTAGQHGVATPVQVSGLTTITAIAGGELYSLALNSDGTVWAWGYGYFGQLGDGNFYTSLPYGVAAPVQVSGFTGAMAIAGGGGHSLAIKSDGTVWAWGLGNVGQLGDGNFYSTGNLGVATPVQVSGLTTATAIAGGWRHSLALKSDGTVWAWGGGTGPEVGEGGFNALALPVQVSGLTSVTAIACGNFHNLALKSDGTVWAWGDGWNGQLGDGNFSSSATPVQVRGLSGVVAIAGGNWHSLAVKSDGTVWAWGMGGNGQLGDGNFHYPGAGTPVQVIGLTSVTAIAGGYGYSFALKADGTVWSWGIDGYGQFGDGIFHTSSPGVARPILASSLGQPVTAIAAGAYHSLALPAVPANAPSPNIRLTRVSAEDQVGALLWLTATVTTDIPTAGAPLPNTLVTFKVFSGPNAGQNGTGTTDASGVASFSYTGLGGLGVDVIQASFVDNQQRIQVSNYAAKDWANLCPTPPITINVYRGFAQGLGSGTPFWDLAGTLTVSDITSATDHAYAWHPFGLSSLGADITGSLDVSDNKTYTFTLDSAGGAFLFIDGNLVINYDGVWAPSTTVGSTRLTAGIHSFEIQFFSTRGVSGVDFFLPRGISFACPPPPLPPSCTLICPQDITVSNDPGICGAIANYPPPATSGDCSGLTIACTPPSGSTFTVGTTLVTCTATDANGNVVANCSFQIFVNDAEPPVASYAIVKAPVLLSNPPRIVGAFQLLATDNCDPDLLIYLKGSAGSFVAGPFHNGDQVEIAHGPSLIPRQAPRTSGGNIASIQLNGDVLLWAGDSSGNTSTPIQCR